MVPTAPVTPKYSLLKLKYEILSNAQIDKLFPEYEDQIHDDVIKLWIDFMENR